MKRARRETRTATIAAYKSGVSAHLKVELLYYPKLNTKEGKRLAQKFEAEELTFSMSKFILDKLHLHRMASGPGGPSRTGYILYHSVAGIFSGKVLVSIPGSKENGQGEDPFPEVPAWLREVKESEWLAAQGR